MLRFISLCGLIGLLVHTSLLAAEYTVTVVNNPRPVSLAGINNNGEVVGSGYQDGTILLNAYYWPAATQGQDLGNMGCSYVNVSECFAKAYAANDNGVIVGEGHADYFYAYAPVAFRWENSVMEPLPTVGLEYSEARDVNNASTIMGFGRATFNYSYVSQAYVLFADTQTLGLWATAPGLASFAYGINAHNTVAGCFAPNGSELTPGFWTDTGNRQYQFTALPAPDTQACVEDINDQNSMIGYSRVSSGGRHAALWTNTQFVDLGTLGVYVDASYANALNNAGQVVGNYHSWERLCRPTCRTESHRLAFIWENGAMTPLDALVEAGVFVNDAFDINEQGQIAASGTVNGHPEFMILTPMP